MSPAERVAVVLERWEQAGWNPRVIEAECPVCARAICDSACEGSEARVSLFSEEKDR